MDFPAPITPLLLTPFSLLGAGADATALGSNMTLASTTWPVANAAFFVPFAVPWPYLVRRVFWANSTSVTSTNRDMGIYNADGIQLYSTGSTAAVGASTNQYVSLGTPLLLVPGSYYMAIASSSITASRGVLANSDATVRVYRAAGILQQTSLPLPADMSAVAALANPMLPVIGITSTASGF